MSSSLTSKSRDYAAVIFDTAEHNPKQHLNRPTAINRVFAKEKKQSNDVVRPAVFYIS